MLPVYNQGDHIGPVVRSYVDALAMLNCDYELILVCNACRDHSVAVCQALCQENPKIRLIESARGGWGLAVNLGLRSAHGDLVCYTNSARTTAAQLVAIILPALLAPGSVVKAERIGRGGLRRLGSSLYNLQCRVLFGIPWRDVNGTPKVFPRSFQSLLELARDDDSVDLEFLIACRQNNYPVQQIPIYAGARHGGESTTKWKSALKLYKAAFQMWAVRR